MRKTYFPQQFLDKYSTLLGPEWGTFFEIIKQKQPKSFWVNTNKTSVENVIESLTKKGIKTTPLLFHPQAFAIDYSEPGKLEEYQKGWISVQEKASMMPVAALNPKKTDKVLDACAAPGMKTLQLSNLAGEILATDVHSKRMEILDKTMKAFEMKNVTVKRIDFRNLKHNKRFDKIILDAPCSSEGLVRKKREALISWSQKLVEKKSIEQKHMIVRAFDYLIDGGEMVYSTCTFAPEEDEEVISHLLKERNGVGEKQKLGKASVVLVQLKGVKIRENKNCPGCVRLYPEDNNTQQFFFAKIKKETNQMKN